MSKIKHWTTRLENKSRPATIRTTGAVSIILRKGRNRKRDAINDSRLISSKKEYAIFYTSRSRIVRIFFLAASVLRTDLSVLF